MTSGEALVDGSLGTRGHSSRHSHDVLTAHIDRSLNDDLDYPGAISNVKERQVFAVLAPLGHPPAHADALADVVLIDRGAEQVAQTRGFNVWGHVHFTSSIVRRSPKQPPLDPRAVASGQTPGYAGP